MDIMNLGVVRVALDTKEKLSQILTETEEMDTATANKLIDTLEDRFISWKGFFVLVIPSYFLMISIPIGVAMWVANTHAAMPAHGDAVSQREWALVDKRLANMEKSIAELRQAVLANAGSRNED